MSVFGISTRVGECAVYSRTAELNHKARDQSRARAECRLVCVLVSEFYQVALTDMLSMTRHSAIAANARHIAMYLAHTRLSVCMEDVATFFRRHRTAVRHACAKIEDNRDDRNIDQSISRLEILIDAAIEMRLSAYFDNSR